MRALLDVNFLIALLDADHVFHERSFKWFEANREYGWASCAMTQNSLVRISSNPKYSGFDPFTVSKSIEQFEGLIEQTDHAFWHDDISLLDSSLFDFARILGPKQITDIYLLALAARHNGRLVTFDERINVGAVVNAAELNLVTVLSE